jgi:hypothetical protein
MLLLFVRPFVAVRLLQRGRFLLVSLIDSLACCRLLQRGTTVGLERDGTRTKVGLGEQRQTCEHDNSGSNNINNQWPLPRQSKSYSRQPIGGWPPVSPPPPTVGPLRGTILCRAIRSQTIERRRPPIDHPDLRHCPVSFACPRIISRQRPAGRRPVNWPLRHGVPAGACLDKAAANTVRPSSTFISGARLRLAEKLAARLRPLPTPPPRSRAAAQLRVD